MSKTSIEWCDFTFNPWWGCTKVSDGCKHCYAETLAHRYKHDVWGPGKPRRTFGKKYWEEPYRWQSAARKEGVRRRVFCASMADVFDADAPVGEFNRLEDLVWDTPGLDWLILTKRPELIAEAFTGTDGERFPNVWLGVSVEDQATADERIPLLLQTPAAVRFVSYEPALGPVDLGLDMIDRDVFAHRRDALHPCDYACGGFEIKGGLDWIIVGGESGPGARPFDIAWARSTVEACKAAGVSVFVKQLGADWSIENSRSQTRRDAPTFASDPKGGDPSRWPEDLRVRDFPR